MRKKFLILFFISIITLTGCGCENKKIENPIVNNPEPDEGILKEQQVGNLKIYDINAELYEGNTSFTIYMQNTSEEDFEIKNFKINFKDNKGKLMLDEAIITPFYSTIKAGEIQALNVFVRKDVTKAKEVIYELVD